MTTSEAPALEPLIPLEIGVARGIPPVSFSVPSSFYALPLGATAEERAAGAAVLVRDLYPNGDEALWEPAALYYAGVAEAIGANGPVYAAMGLFRTDDPDAAAPDDAPGSTASSPIPGGTMGDAGTSDNARMHVAHCSFTVAATASDHSSAEVAATGIREILVRDEHNDARWIDLPCGPAVSCVTLSELVIDGRLTSSGDEARLLTGQIQVYVPFPNGPFVAVFTLDTAAVDYWGEFSDIMSAILQSLTFPDPDTDTEPAPLAAAPTQPVG